MTLVTASERDLRALAGIVSDDRPDLPAEEGLPPSLLADLMGQIRCDVICVRGHRQRPAEDVVLAVHPGPAQRSWTERPRTWIRCNGSTTGTASRAVIPTGPATCAASSRSPTSTRPGNGIPSACAATSTGRWGSNIELQLCLPEPPGRVAGPGRTVRLYFFRGPGPDFSERDRDLLTLLRPHLHQAYLDAERRRHPTPQLTPRHWELLHLVAAGHTNTQIARRLGLSEGTVRTHLENIYARLQVSSRTAAVTRAFPDRAA